MTAKRYRTEEGGAAGATTAMSTGGSTRSAEREHRLADLIGSPVLSWEDVSLYADLPRSTLDLLRAQGRGPMCFRLGRRLYVRQCDFRAWIDRMASEESA
jgi:hypothetical protein